MNSSRNEIRDDEIDIIELIISIWKGRWFILSFALAALLLSGAYIFISSDKFNAEIEINHISDDKFSAYRELIETEAYPISRDMLLELFIEKLKSSNVIFEKFKEDLISNGGTNKNIDQVASSLANTIEIKPGKTKEKNSIYM